MAKRGIADVWADGAGYEIYVGRWSRIAADLFIDWLAPEIARDWLDVGCGTGALTQRILARCGPRRIVGLDPSDGFLAAARAAIDDPAVGFERADAESLPFGDDTFDYAVSGLCLNFVPEPARALSEMRRVLRPGGVGAVYVWDYAGQMEMIRHFWDAATALDPAAADLDEGRRFPICNPDALDFAFGRAGFSAVATTPLDTQTLFSDFDDYWCPFLSGQGPAPGYCTSLDESARSALRERLRATLPTQTDGSILMVARAWGARGHA